MVLTRRAPSSHRAISILTSHSQQLSPCDMTCSTGLGMRRAHLQSRSHRHGAGVQWAFGKRPETLAGQNSEAERLLPNCCLLRGLTSSWRRPDVTIFKCQFIPNSVSDTVTSSVYLNLTATP